MTKASGKLRLLARIAVVTSLATGLSAGATAEDPASHLQKIIAVNSLDQAGKAPFHIKIAFQVFSLEGKPFDTGFLEEWWASPGESLLTLTSSAAKIVDPVPFDDSVTLDPRERYLLRKLLESELHPVPVLEADAIAKLQEAPRTFDKLTLTCIRFPPTITSATGGYPLSFCVDPQTDAVRAQYEAEAGSMMHNTPANFYGTTVPVDLEISFLKRGAITGKVVGLEVFDPSKLAVKLPIDSSLANAPSVGCVLGQTVKKGPPIYPFSASTSHLGGSVVLQGVISKEGTVNDVIAIASSSVLFTQAAVDAFRQWKYKPCLLNSQPTEFKATFTMNFQFGK